ncbi:MAG: 16S rRNA (cytidine(1402)-2'-O)-methyltransferase [Chloroflexi bacterium]|nr:16S rRNA (cytidine(1402)-2'-O)-methyltransferase [Chloroflexota bacterium]MDA1283241.1 16S rRNA (cytidine(1402)-2'-O)-methyltransferase [Chloroflexota bacterium]
MSTLYVVATPIGNLSDISQRAIEILSTVLTVAAEDTRVSRKLLNHIGVSPRLESLHEHTSPERLQALVEKLELGDMAVVSDAGTPGISDPGSALVAAAVEAGHDVIPIPGPSAIVSALSITGWSFDRFLFLGFLPRKKNEQLATLENASQEPGPVVAYESPHRIKATLENINDTFADRQLVICRELTKFYEETFRGTAAEAIAHFNTQPKGEFVVVIQGAGKSANTELSDDDISEVLGNLKENGLSGRTLVERAAEITRAPKNRIYQLSLNKDSK